MSGFALEPQPVQTIHFSGEVPSASSFQECPKDRRTWLSVIGTDGATIAGDYPCLPMDSEAAQPSSACST